jgi:hypothetical protein
MRLNFAIVVAGVWQCMERPEIQVRNCKARMSKVDPRAVEAYPGWAVFVNGIELLTAGREKSKRHAQENAQAYVDREAEVAARAEQARRDADLAVEADRIRAKDAAALLPAYDPEAGASAPDANRQRQGRKLIGPARAHLDAPCTDACYEPVDAEGEHFASVEEIEEQLDPRDAPPLSPSDHANHLARRLVEVLSELPAVPARPDPATDDDVHELVDRIIRRSHYVALKVVLKQLDGWIAGNLENVEGGIGELEAVHRFHTQDVRRMVNDAARELRVPEPYREAGADV